MRGRDPPSIAFDSCSISVRGLTPASTSTSRCVYGATDSVRMGASSCIGMTLETASAADVALATSAIRASEAAAHTVINAQRAGERRTPTAISPRVDINRLREGLAIRTTFDATVRRASAAVISHVNEAARSRSDVACVPPLTPPRSITVRTAVWSTAHCEATKSNSTHIAAPAAGVSSGGAPASVGPGATPGVTGNVGRETAAAKEPRVLGCSPAAQLDQDAAPRRTFAAARGSPPSTSTAAAAAAAA